MNWLLFVSCHRRLNEYISHYEELNYDHEHIRASHNRAKRSVTKDHHVDLKFSAHGRDFHLRLKRDLNTFSDKLEFYDSNNLPLDVATDHIYEGEVIGDRNSYVFGSILDGVFEGKIITERDAYYVEHAKRYFSPTTTAAVLSTNGTEMPLAQRLVAEQYTATTAASSPSASASTSTTSSTTTTTRAPTTTMASTTTTSAPLKTSPTSAGNHKNGQTDDNRNIGFHSIIYKESHVDDAYKDMREGHVGGCGITEEVSQWMESIQNSAVEELPEPMSKDDLTHQKQQLKYTRPNSARLTQTQEEAEQERDNAAFLTNKKHKKSTIAPATTTATRVASAQQRPPKKYSSHTAGTGETTTMTTAPRSDSIADYSTSTPGDDDFKYPYQKYSKDANFRFDDDADSAWRPFSPKAAADDIYGMARDSNSDGSNFNGKSFSGAFYDPETGRKYTPQYMDRAEWHAKVHERVRRAAGGNPNGPAARREENKNTCSLYIQTDPLIWRHIREGIADHDRGRKYEIDVKTREEITSLIAHHVTAVNYIYRNTKFDGRSEHRNIRFEVQRIKIDDDSACRNSYNGPHNAFCNEHMDVSNFLNLHSLEDHSDFCLAYVFTYRDFTGGTLGLAWVASASGASGGICEKFKTYTETVGGQYQSTKRSLNTGIITFVNYNSRVPPKVSQLTLAHEIGHNFGSPHDYPLECRPGGLNGNFIMFASATSGDRPNNSKFSPCSVRNISNVLDVLVGNSKRDCFEVSEGAFCGNKIVESGEECDCGFNEEECKDICCYPRIISEYDFSMNSSAKGCTRRAKTECSPSQGPCCLSNSCQFVPTNYHQKCKEETECSWSSTCNGTTAECPEPKPRDDKTKCNNGTALCIRGECSGSICLLWNMTECFLTSQAVPHVDKRRLCELACQNGNDSGTCRSTSEFAHKFGLPEGGINLRPGSPCDNFQGYCDVFLKCRAVDADGPLVRLKNLLLNRETLLTVAQWITEYWYYVVIMGVGFIIVMGIFIKCCAVHTPSSNPKKRRARRISETLRAPMNTLRRMQRHHQGRGAGPRSIPPPAHEQRGGGGAASGNHRSAHPHHWDRHQGGHSVVPLPTGGPHHVHNAGGRAAATGASAVAASGRTPANGRSSRPSTRPSSGTRSTTHGGYGDIPPTGLVVGGVPTGVGVSSGVGGGVPNGALIVSGSGGGNGPSAGVIARQQMPLPLPPTSAVQAQQLQQQQQQQQVQATLSQAYYAPPKAPAAKRNKSRNPATHISLAAAAGRSSKETPQRTQQAAAKKHRKVVY
ncbi:disintegrin and metalloproteinase domain-containing protein 10 [Anastrepha obliqua]|uniref:disintegrin and metalloproteinase domain-containing protein 10 n=1 Tax=Anastrepha obliqua TaxID=95512 RepID=UPI002409BDAF|nr:disintegrin and metalloproteinase domain-containing protein 10 [Anastrepha obliqua]